MPIYQFKCSKCKKNNNKDCIFEIQQSMSEYSGKAECPECGKLSKKRIFNTFAIHQGLNACEKIAGTTKQRFETGKHMKNERDKRKKNAEPGTKDAISNEYWTGTEGDRGVISKPGK
jgi:putative FmdB family regulatory protein